jgi:hypothetical protein
MVRLVRIILAYLHLQRLGESKGLLEFAVLVTCRRVTVLVVIIIFYFGGASLAKSGRTIERCQALQVMFDWAGSCHLSNGDNEGGTRKLPPHYVNLTKFPRLITSSYRAAHARNSDEMVNFMI